MPSFDKKWEKKSPKSKQDTAGGPFQEAHAGFHAWNDLAFGLAQKVEGFAVSLIRISEFSPESFHDVLVFITNAIPQRILFPNGLDLLHKRRVFFPSLKRGDFKDGKRNDVLAARTSEDLTLLSAERVQSPIQAPGGRYKKATP